MEYKPSKGFKSDLNLLRDKLLIYRDNFNSAKITQQTKSLVYNIDLNVNFDRYERKYYYSPFIISDRLYTIIPFEVNNNNINIAIFNTKLNNIYLNSCLNDKNICSIHTLKKK